MRVELPERVDRARLVLLAVLLLTAPLAGCVGGLDGGGTTDDPASPGSDVATGPEESADGGSDGSTDAGSDGSTDAGSDGSGDDGSDGSTDADSDGSRDAGAAEPPTLSAVGVDANATWNRTLALLDVEAERPTVRIRVVDEPPPAFAYELRDALTVLTGATSDAQPAAWYDYRADTVTMRAGAVEERSPAAVEALLAHEYAHAVQFQREWDATSGVETGRSETAYTLYLEGMASYVQASYASRYLPDAPDPDPENRSLGTDPAERLVRAPYVVGARYYDERVSSPSDVDEVAADPPGTTEQALHHTEAGPRPLDVQVEYSIRNWSVTHGERLGELPTRAVLHAAVAEERAAAAAAGWGNDELATFDHPAADQSGYLWVHRWDDASEADEFEHAAEQLAERRDAASEEYGFEVARPAPEVTVLVAGSGGFPGEVSIAADGNASVSVAVPN